MNYSSDTMLWVPWVCRGFAVGVLRVCCWDLTTLASQYAAGFIMSKLTYNNMISYLCKNTQMIKLPCSRTDKRIWAMQLHMVVKQTSRAGAAQAQDALSMHKMRSMMLQCMHQ